MCAGVPPGLASRPPVVSSSPTSGVSVPTAPRASSGLVSSRTCHRSAAVAGTPRTPADYAFGRRTLTAATPRPPSTHHCPPAVSPGPLLRPSTARRKTTQDFPPSSPATGPGGTPLVLPVPLPPVPRLPSTTAPTRQTPPRLPEPVVEPDDDSLLRSCVEHYTSTEWARE